MKNITVIHGLRDFLLLWSSQAVSELGTAMTDYALIIWVYGQSGKASSVTLLTICAFLPTILFRFVAGALADRWDKKRVMLLSDAVAACGTATVFALYAAAALRTWHLYIITALLSLMNAFQVPAAFVAVSLLTPKEHYARVGGLQGVSASVVSILAPALGSALLAFGGLRAVLICDLASFFVAFTVLLCFIRIPKVEAAEKEKGEPFTRSCLAGFRWLRAHAALLRVTLFLAVVNFLAKLGNDGMLSPFVLGRTGNDQRALGAVQSAVALGLLAGSLAVTAMKPAKDRARVVFLTCAAVFSGNIIQSLTRQPVIWCAAAFVCYGMAAVMNANLTAILRDRVPLEMQGCVSSVKNTLQNCTIPLGLFLGGALADGVFEPLMAGDSPAQRALSRLFGTGGGAGIAVMFFGVGVAGMALCLTRLGKRAYDELND